MSRMMVHKYNLVDRAYLQLDKLFTDLWETSVISFWCIEEFFPICIDWLFLLLQCISWIFFTIVLLIFIFFSKGSKLAEFLACWPKCLAVVCPLHSEFKPHWEQLYYSSFWGQGNKYQLSTGVNVIDSYPFPKIAILVLKSVINIYLLFSVLCLLPW